METNQKEREVNEMFNTKYYAVELLESADWYSRRCKRCIKWSIFFAFVGVLLMVGVTVLNFPLINNAPIYDMEDQVVYILLIVGAVMNILAMILSAVAKKHHLTVVELLIRRGNLPNYTPLYVQMI